MKTGMLYWKLVPERIISVHNRKLFSYNFFKCPYYLLWAFEKVVQVFLHDST